MALLSSAGIAFGGNSVIVTELNNDNGKLTMSQERKIKQHNEASFNTTVLWEDPIGGGYYLKADDIDPELVKSGEIPVKKIHRSPLVTHTHQVSTKSSLAIADKVTQESLLANLSHFTDIARSLLGGRVPERSIMGHTTDNLFNSEDRVRWIASIDDSDMDSYSGQEESDSYGARISDSVNKVVSGPWFTVMQMYGNYFHQDAMDDLSGFKSSGYGLQGGILRPVGDTFLLGIYGDWQHIDADIEGNHGKVEVNPWRIGPALAWGEGAAHVEGVLAYGKRSVSNKLVGYHSEYQDNQWDVYIRGGIDLDLGGVTQGLSLTPDIQVLYSSQNRESFDWGGERFKEAGAKGWVSRVGGTFAYDQLQFEQPLELKLSTGWQYNQFTTDNLEAESGRAFNIHAYDHHAWYYYAGVDTRVNEALNLSLSYAGTWSAHALGHYLQAGMEFRF